MIINALTRPGLSAVLAVPGGDVRDLSSLGEDPLVEAPSAPSGAIGPATTVFVWDGDDLLVETTGDDSVWIV